MTEIMMIKKKMIDAGIDAYILHRGKDADSEELVWEIYKAMQDVADNSDELTETEIHWYDYGYEAGQDDFRKEHFP